MNKITTIVIALFAFSLNIFAQKTQAELLVANTQYEYLLSDTAFVSACADVISQDSAELKISELTLDDRNLMIFTAQSYSLVKKIDMTNKNTIKESISSAKQKLSELEKEAQIVLSKDNFKEYKKVNKMVKMLLNISKMFVI